MHIYSLHSQGISDQSTIFSMSNVMVPSYNFFNIETKEGESWAPGHTGLYKKTLFQDNPLTPKLFQSLLFDSQ